MRAWLEQPHGRRHKAPPQPCALTTKAISCLTSSPPIMGECRKLDTEPLGSLGTLRVLGSVVVCMVVCMRVQHSQRHRHGVARIAARTQHKRNGRKKWLCVTLVSLPALGTSEVRQATTTQPPPTPVLARPAAGLGQLTRSSPAGTTLHCRSTQQGIHIATDALGAVG